MQIADYHVILWTSVLLGAVTLFVVYVMLGMDDRKDPQLYAQIRDSAPGMFRDHCRRRFR